MPGPRKRGVTTFNDRWLADERFKRWLKKVPGDSTKALCIFVQQQENSHCQHVGFGPGLSQEFQEAQ